MFHIQTFLYMEIDILALAVLFLICINLIGRTDRHLPEQRLYLTMLGVNALILLFDLFMWFLDGKTGGLVRIGYYFVTVLYYILNPVFCTFWLILVQVRTCDNAQLRKKQMLLFWILPGINLILSMSSIANGLLFSIDESNVYHRGPLFLFMALICYGYVLLSLIMVLLRKDRLEQHTYVPMLLIAIPPVISGIIQCMFYGVSIIWASTAISLLFYYIHYQNNQLDTDYLTGAFNRRQLDHYLRQLERAEPGGELLAGMMIDLDAFKTINDVHGHDAGDEALRIVTGILRKTFRKQDFIARYGGDEFVIVMKISRAEDLNRAVCRLRDNVNQFNLHHSVPYAISLSIGYDIYAPSHAVPVRDFVKHLDDLMYEDKLRRPEQPGQ